MFNFGPQTGYIVASYAIFALGLLVLIAASLMARRTARRRLAALEQTEARP